MRAAAAALQPSLDAAGALNGHLMNDGLGLVPSPVGAQPIGYAVRMADGPFVGIWQDEATAKSVRDKQPPSHGDQVVPVYAAPPSAIAPSAASLNFEVGLAARGGASFMLDGKQHRVCDCDPHKGPCAQGRERALLTCELSRCLVPVDGTADFPCDATPHCKDKRLCVGFASCPSHSATVDNRRA